MVEAFDNVASVPSVDPEVLAEFEQRRKARQIQVSTDDSEIKSQLRKLHEPICLFGEGPAERRERLRRLMAGMSEAELSRKLGTAVVAADIREDKGKVDEGVTWYHEGPDTLREAREWIALDSLMRARDRIQWQKSEQQAIELEGKVYTQTRFDAARKQLSEIDIHCSQVGDVRPLSYCCISPNDELLVTSSWTGNAKLWSLPDCDEPLREFKGGHGNSYMCSAEFHPQATLTLDRRSNANLATSGFDGTVRMWALDGDSTNSFGIEINRQYRVSRVRYHPSGRFIAACCHDESWRLYDMEAGQEILHQEGHVGPVLDLAFQSDGSVCVTGGEDTYGRVWDLRTGRCIMFLNGHLKAVLSTTFSPNGYHMATGGLDNTVKIWDLRQARELVTIAAHTNLVSQVKFQKQRIALPYLMSASFDTQLKAWSSMSWNVIKLLSGHEQRITSFDINSSGDLVVTCSADKSFKVWK